MPAVPPIDASDTPALLALLGMILTIVLLYRGLRAKILR
jgi:hypothetical protein